MAGYVKEALVGWCYVDSFWQQSFAQWKERESWNSKENIFFLPRSVKNVSSTYHLPSWETLVYTSNNTFFYQKHYKD